MKCGRVRSNDKVQCRLEYVIGNGKLYAGYPVLPGYQLIDHTRMKRVTKMKDRCLHRIACQVAHIGSPSQWIETTEH